jgi:uncharacterized protein (TIGR02466 family)
MTHSLFATSVFQAKLWPSTRATEAFNRQLMKEILLLQREDLAGQKWSKENYRHGYTSYGSIPRIFEHSPSFLELKENLDKKLKAYLLSLEVMATPKQLWMSSMWVNVMPSGSYHTMHTHPFSVISGTYYVDLPRGASPIKFEDPRSGLMMNAPLIKENALPAKQRFFELQPQSGETVMFESWLRHEVPENSASRPRVSISFNYDWAGDGSR